jgi:hypothetical protein
VVVAGAPRPLAQAKHCNWVLQRQSLEKLKQQGFDEVILQDASSGALLEGLASNFYVVANAASLPASSRAATSSSSASSSSSCLYATEGSLAAAAAADGVTGNEPLKPALLESFESDPGSSSNTAAAASLTEGLVLMTTGATEAALWGITQQRVLQACAAIGLQVELQPPLPVDLSAWQEAFLTNRSGGRGALSFWKGEAAGGGLFERWGRESN